MTEPQEDEKTLDEQTGLTEEERQLAVESFKQEQAMMAAGNEFVRDLTQVIMDYQSKLSLAYMAKVCFSTAVDLLVNQSALQSHSTVSQLREELKTQEQSKIIRP